MDAGKACLLARPSELATFLLFFYPLLVESVFFGLHLSLTFMSVICLWSKPSRKRIHFILLATIFVMFAVATVHWTMDIILTGEAAAFLGLCTPIANAETLVLVPSNIQLINFLLSDIIVSCRAWILWERNQSILIILSSLVFASFGISIVNLASNLAPAFPPIISENVGLVVLTLSATNNLVATSLTAYKIWQRRMDYKPRRKLLGLSVLTLLTESGLIYTLIWLFFLASEFNLLGSGYLSSCIQKSIVQITAIYPAIIILLIFLEKTVDQNAIQLDSDDLISV